MPEENNAEYSNFTEDYLPVSTLIYTEHTIVKCRYKPGWRGTYADCRGRPSDFIREIELLK